ncbi:hypothetical protein MDA_GLEAN10009396 [Myotis davidii]|uniref:Uncharacterized protein n=1 Tax=Myotis davidii TaxID=225400 RepID=L5M0R6_MYODS|nr:hypothetical protein MDA_GLEAN10009396 [Myotis davidii]
MTCTDHKGAARNTAGICNAVLEAHGSGGAASPDGPQRERDRRAAVSSVTTHLDQLTTYDFSDGVQLLAVVHPLESPDELISLQAPGLQPSTLLHTMAHLLVLRGPADGVRAKSGLQPPGSYVPCGPYSYCCSNWDQTLGCCAQPTGTAVATRKTSLALP